MRTRALDVTVCPVVIADFCRFWLTRFRISLGVGLNEPRALAARVRAAPKSAAVLSGVNILPSGKINTDAHGVIAGLYPAQGGPKDEDALSDHLGGESLTATCILDVAV